MEKTRSEYTLGETVMETDMLFQDKRWTGLKRGAGCQATVRPVHQDNRLAENW